MMRCGVQPKDARLAVVPTVVSSPWCDGKLNDPSWKQATEVGDFQVRINAREPSATTTVLLLSDGRNLQIAFRCQEPTLVEAQDRSVSMEDSVSVHFDVGLSRRQASSFTIYLSGRREGSRPAEGWQGAVLPGEDEWVAQFMLPFKTLGREPEAGEVWGLALARSRFADKNYPEVSTWGPSDLESHNPRDFGLVVFRGRLSEKEAFDRARAVQARLQAQEEAEHWQAVTSLGPSDSPGGDEAPLTRGAEWRLGEQRATVTAVGNEQIIRSPYTFLYERADEPQLRELRERYGLDVVVEGAADDLEEATRLQRWTIDHITFGPAAHHDYNALRVLEDSARGRTFICTHFSYVLMQCCMALGIPARKLSTIGHASVEFWSNHYRKWVALECTRGHFFEMADIPLSALEIHNEYIKNGGVNMDFSVGDQRVIRKVSLERRPDGMIADAQERYSYVAYLLRNNILSVPFELGEIRFLWYRDDANRDLREFVVREGDPPVRFRMEPEEGYEPILTATENPDDIYWTLNQAELHVREGTSGLEVSAATVTPNFARTEARFDEGDWHTVGSTFPWTLHPGENRLEVRPVNAFGRAGVTSSLTLEVAP